MGNCIEMVMDTMNDDIDMCTGSISQWLSFTGVIEVEVEVEYQVDFFIRM